MTNEQFDELTALEQAAYEEMGECVNCDEHDMLTEGLCVDCWETIHE